jgi:predicted XRE-type DNA-binding protein
MKKTSSKQLAKKLGISQARGMEAIINAELISAVIQAAKKQRITHAELAKRSGLPRSAVTGILSGSLQKITIDRVLKLIEAAGLVAKINVKKAA